MKPQTFVKAFCADTDVRRARMELIQRNESSIRWIENELATKTLTPAQREEYRHRIRRLEIMGYKINSRNLAVTTKPKSKWRFAIGTTSLVPTAQRLHYLIADVDEVSYVGIGETLRHFAWLGIKNFTLQRTRHGWHIYTDTRMPWRKLTATLSHTPGIDQAWLRIGLTRGYLFLADKALVPLNWPVKRMTLTYAPKSKPKNAKTK